MKAYDFEFDGKKLSDFGFIICNFGSKGLETVSNGSQITFNTVSTLGGSRHDLVSTSYEECLETTIQICKASCGRDVSEISSIEHRNLTKWLSRKKFLKFKILDEDYIDLYFEVNFNISRIEIDGKLYGLELTIKTNRPFALKEPKTVVIEASQAASLEYIWNKYRIDVIDTVSEEYVGATPDDYYQYDGEYGTQYFRNYEISSLYYPIKSSFALKNQTSELIYPFYGYRDGYLADVKSIYKCMQTDPSGNFVGEAWYLLTLETEFQKSERICSVSSTKKDAFPSDEIQDGYWYVYVGENNVAASDGKYTLSDISHEEGYIYPHTEITILENGNLNIHNSIEDRNTYIGNCVAGEVITMDYPVIQSSISSHNIQNDFNWNFFRIANTYENSRNELTISLPCTIKIKYSPIVKVGL